MRSPLRTAKSPLPVRLIAILLLVSDMAGLVVFLCVSFRMRIGEWPDALIWSMTWPFMLTLLSLYVVDVYRPESRALGLSVTARVFLGVALGGLFTAVVAYAGGYWGREQAFGRGVLPVALALFAFWAAGWRALVSAWIRRRAGSIRWLVLGTGEAAQQLWRDFRNSHSEGDLVFLARDEEERRRAQAAGLHTTDGALADLDSWGVGRCSGVIITLPAPLQDGLVHRLMHMRFSGLRVFGLTDFYEHFWSKVPVLHLHSGWFVLSHGFDLLHNPLRLRTKRALDVMLSLFLLVALMPVMAVVAALVRFDSRGPAIYRQQRSGDWRRVFTIYKFRSMRADAENDGAKWAHANDSRVTRLGRFLRATRLDELPQLMNVLRGDMSFIGPRPERPEFIDMLERAIPYYELRSLVRPGITGWAQVQYPYGASIEDAREKLQYDLYYIKNYSLLLDVTILFKTLRVILLGKGR